MEEGEGIAHGEKGQMGGKEGGREGGREEGWNPKSVRMGDAGTRQVMAYEGKEEVEKEEEADEEEEEVDVDGGYTERELIHYKRDIVQDSIMHMDSTEERGIERKWGGGRCEG